MSRERAALRSAKEAAPKQSRAAGAAASDDPSAGLLADAILKAIRRILRKTAEHSRQLARESGLSVPQLICLRRIAQAAAGDELTAAQLTEAVQLSAPTVSRILERLESHKLIQRERLDTDRRKVRLRATRSGKARVRSLPAPLQEQFLLKLRARTRREQQQLLHSLETLVSMMGAADMDAAPLLAPEIDVKPEG